MLRANWKTLLLSVSAVVEGVTALGLIVVPQLVMRLLFGASLPVAGVAIARIAGIALFSLSLDCWMGRREGASGSIVMLIYNILVTPYLLHLGIGGELVGILLWPAVVVHAAFTLLFIYSLVSRNEHQVNKTRNRGSRTILVGHSDDQLR
jgi:hypothetical protein